MNRQQHKEEIDRILNSDLNQRAEELWKWLKGQKQETMIEVLELVAICLDLIKLQDKELERPDNYDVRHVQTEFYQLSTTAKKVR